MESTNPRPPLRRAREGRVLGGVAAGVAAHLGIDVVLVRILVVALTLVNGLGLILYVIAWVAIPEAEPVGPGAGQRPPRPAQTERRDALFWVGLALLVLGAVWFVSGPLTGPFGFAVRPLRELAVPLVLVAFGLALWRSGDRSGADETWSTGSPPDSTPATSEQAMTTTESARPRRADAAGDPWSPSGGGAHGAPPPPPGAPGGVDVGGPRPPTPTASDEGWTPPPEPPRPRSVLTRVTLGVALVTLGVLWSLDLAGALSLGFVVAASAALLVIGLGLLVASVAGRAPGLVAVGAVLSVLLLLVQTTGPWGPLAGIDTDGRAGQLRPAPATLDELEEQYQLGAGSIRLDLTGLELDGASASVDLEVGVGEIRVTVPDDVEVEATGRTGIGEVRVFDQRSAGIGAGEQTATFTPTDPDGELELDLSAGIGSVRVQTVPAGR